MGEYALSALRVINGAAGKVSANRHPNHAGRGKSIVRAPADQRQFVAQLHHGRPDVIEELNLDHRLQPARSHAGGAAHDVGLRNRRVKHPVRAEFDLQPGRELEDAALALDHFLLEIFLAAAVGDIFAENDDALVAPHLVAQGGIDQVGHGFGVDRLLAVRRRSLGLGRLLGLKSGRGGIEISRINVAGYRVRRRRNRLQRVIHRGLQIVVHLLLQPVDALFVENAFADEEHLHARHRVAGGVPLTFCIRAVEPFVIGERMRVRPDHVRVNEPRPAAGAAVSDGAGEGGVAGAQFRAVYLFKMKIGKSAHQARDVAPRHLGFDRHRDRVFVVLHQKDQRQPPVGSGIQGFPELAFAAGTLAEGNIGELILVGDDVVELAIVADGFLGRRGMRRHVARDLGAADRLQNLRAGRRRSGYDIQPRIAPVRGHLPPTRTGVIGRPHALQQHLIGRRTQSQAERPVAVVGIKPVVAGP